MNPLGRSARLLRALFDQIGPIEPTRADWNEWVQLAKNERVLPLLYRIATTTDLDLSVEQGDNATEFQIDVMATMVRFEHDLLDVAQALQDKAVRFAILKGAATAHLDYSDPSWRQFGDIDLLVAPDDFRRAVVALGNAGWHQGYPLPRNHEQFTHAITLRNSKRVEVDLHQRIAHRAIGELIPTEELLANVVPYSIANQVLSALSPTDRLIHASLHSITSRGEYRRLSSMADVLVLADANSRFADAVLARAESWRVRSLVEAALRSAYSTAQMPLPASWEEAASRPTHRRDRLVERAHLSPRRRPLIEELAYLRLMRGLGRRVQYLLGYFSTDADYAQRNRRTGVVQQSRYLWARLRSRT